MSTASGTVIPALCLPSPVPALHPILSRRTLPMPPVTGAALVNVSWRNNNAVPTTDSSPHEIKYAGKAKWSKSPWDNYQAKSPQTSHKQQHSSTQITIKVPLYRQKMTKQSNYIIYLKNSLNILHNCNIVQSITHTPQFRFNQLKALTDKRHKHTPIANEQKHKQMVSNSPCSRCYEH